MQIPKHCQIEKVVNKKDHRPSLRYVWADTSRECLFAVNGIAMAVVPIIVEEGDINGPIATEKIIDARKSGRLTAADVGDSHDLKEIPFDNVARGVEFEDTPTISFNAKALYNLARALGSDHVSLTLSANHPKLSTIRVTPAGPNLQATYGYLMPVK